jgi:hypothetical protein
MENRGWKELGSNGLIWKIGGQSDSVRDSLAGSLFSPGGYFGCCDVLGQATAPLGLR